MIYVVAGVITAAAGLVGLLVLVEPETELDDLGAEMMMNLTEAATSEAGAE